MSTATESPSHSEMSVVDELMTRTVNTMSPDQTAGDAVKTMAVSGIRHMVVVNESKLIGVFSQRDLLRHLARAFTDRFEAKEVSVTHFMSNPVTTTTPDAPLALAAFMMSERKIGCLPVLNRHDRVVGIITRTDVLRYLGNLGVYEGLLENR